MRNEELFFQDHKTTRPQDYKRKNMLTCGLVVLLTCGLVVLLTLNNFPLNNDLLNFVCSIVIWHEFKAVHRLGDYHVC